MALRGLRYVPTIRRDLRELLVAFTRTRAFSHRKPSVDEVLQ